MEGKGGGGLATWACVCWRGAWACKCNAHARCAQRALAARHTPAAAACTRVRSSRHQQSCISVRAQLHTFPHSRAPLASCSAALREETDCWRALVERFSSKNNNTPAGLMRAEQKRPHPLSHTPSSPPPCGAGGCSQPHHTIATTKSLHVIPTCVPPPLGATLHPANPPQSSRTSRRPLRVSIVSSPVFSQLFLHEWMNWRPPPPLMMSNRHTTPSSSSSAASARARLTPTGRSRRCRPC